VPPWDKHRQQQEEGNKQEQQVRLPPDNARWLALLPACLAFARICLVQWLTRGSAAVKLVLLAVRVFVKLQQQLPLLPHKPTRRHKQMAPVQQCKLARPLALGWS
jgi:hypothetical protein